MSDYAAFIAQFAIDASVNATIASQSSGIEVVTGPLKMVNAWGITLELGTRPRAVFIPWHRVHKVEKA